MAATSAHYEGKCGFSSAGRWFRAAKPVGSTCEFHVRIGESEGVLELRRQFFPSPPPPHLARLSLVVFDGGGFNGCGDMPKTPPFLWTGPFWQVIVPSWVLVVLTALPPVVAESHMAKTTQADARLLLSLRV